jgi:hypothetical protein
MANQKITELRSLTSASISPNDLFIVVDIDETTSPTGETKNINFTELAFAINTSSGSLEVIKDVFVIDSSSLASKQLVLSDDPVDVTDATMEIRSAPAQVAGYDYTITGSIVDWNGLTLDGQFTVGDIVTVKFQRIID